MDSPLPFGSILRPNLNEIGRPYVLHLSQHRSGWLLPDEPALRRVGLRAFGRSGVKGFLGRTLLAAGRLRGRRLWLEVGPLERELARTLGEPDVRLAFSIGTSGAYRKLTAQVIASGERVPAYAKIAVHMLAQASLEREHKNLLRLSTIDALHGRVPGVLAWFPWHGAQVLVITAGSGRVGPSRFGESHAEFLQRLHEAFADEEPFAASGMWARMVTTARRLGPLMSGEWSRRCRNALNRLRTRLGPVVLPFSVAHRDFTPWNTRAGPQGLYVFDWEAAVEGTTPLYDVFHFQAIQAALAGRPYHPSRGRQQHLVAAFWPKWQAHLAPLYLAYLMDMGLFYTQARLEAPEWGDDRVQRWLAHHIDAYTEGRHAVA